MTGRIFFNRVEIFCLMRTGTFFIRIAAKTRQIGQRSPSYFNQLIGSDQFREYAELVRCRSILYCHAGEKPASRGFQSSGFRVALAIASLPGMTNPFLLVTAYPLGA